MMKRRGVMNEFIKRGRACDKLTILGLNNTPHLFAKLPIYVLGGAAATPRLVPRSDALAYRINQSQSQRQFSTNHIHRRREKEIMFDNCRQPSPKQRERVLPKRIILVRHGESAGNIDGAAYATTPDNRIPLTPLGIQQAEQAGARIHDVVSYGGACSNWKVYFYVSPYARTRSTLRGIGRAFPRSAIIGAREECRIREQDFGNFQVAERMKVIKEIRERFGRFFYRFPEGESAADVFDRVSSFLESLWRDIDMNRLHRNPDDELNLVIVSHGLAIRVFLMKWFKWTVEQFELLNNLGNCEFQVMQLGDGGEYSLAVQHSDEEMQEWGLSPDMIADQRWRAQANKGDWNDSCPWYLDTFFDEFADSNSEDGEDILHPSDVDIQINSS